MIKHKSLAKFIFFISNPSLYKELASPLHVRNLLEFVSNWRMVYKCYVKQISIACDYAIAFIFKLFSLRAQRHVADAWLDRWMVAKYAS